MRNETHRTLAAVQRGPVKELSYEAGTAPGAVEFPTAVQRARTALVRRARRTAPGALFICQNSASIHRLNRRYLRCKSRNSVATPIVSIGHARWLRDDGDAALWR